MGVRSLAASRCGACALESVTRLEAPTEAPSPSFDSSCSPKRRQGNVRHAISNVVAVIPCVGVITSVASIDAINLVTAKFDPAVRSDSVSDTIVIGFGIELVYR